MTDLATDNIRLRRELEAAQQLAADYLKNAKLAARRAADENQTLRRGLDTAQRHQHDNAELRGQLNQARRIAVQLESKATRLADENANLRRDNARLQALLDHVNTQAAGALTLAREERSLRLGGDAA